ncbi:cyclophilin [Pyrrhoderma noxium]|uniref:Peptidyl-prolyl cis-trans isomerase n=1 Tax=Pyrrhoderma noxium TaxID=2282107 RepID=A0A286UP73_9AGAM|nr:cyclophilin [Pyrrhoderma noxium]
MSVLLETSLGDIVIDLEVESCPRTCQNFLKLCKVYYYNLNAFFNVSKDFLAQAGDPTATGTGGESIWSYIASQNKHTHRDTPRYFVPELVSRLKHAERGTVSMAVAPALEGAQDMLYHEGRPLKDVRIRHVEVLDDPFDDPEGLVVPDSPPINPPDDSTRIAEDEDPLATLPEEEEEKERRKKAAAASALTLEMVIRDKVTGDSLQYAFIEFDKREDAEQAYFKMQNVLIDDRRIWVDFSQSVARMNTHWSNDVKTGRQGKGGRGRGGFAGRDDLEKTRKYRVQDESDDKRDKYDMVFDVHDTRRRDDRERRRDARSRSRERYKDKKDRRDRRSRSPPPRDRERVQNRDRDRDSYRRRRSRSRDRYDHDRRR